MQNYSFHEKVPLKNRKSKEELETSKFRTAQRKRTATDAQEYKLNSTKFGSYAITTKNIKLNIAAETMAKIKTK